MPPKCARCLMWWTLRERARLRSPGSDSPCRVARTARRVDAGIAGAFLDDPDEPIDRVVHRDDDRRVAREAADRLGCERGPSSSCARTVGVVAEHVDVGVDHDLEAVAAVALAADVLGEKRLGHHHECVTVRGRELTRAFRGNAFRHPDRPGPDPRATVDAFHEDRGHLRRDPEAALERTVVGPVVTQVARHVACVRGVGLLPRPSATRR